MAVTMEKSGPGTGVELFEVLLPGLARSKLVDQVTALLSHMENQGIFISKNLIANVMISFANQQMFTVAQEFKRILEDSGTQLTRVQYLKLIRGSATSNCPEHTTNLVKEMAKHYSISADVYYWMITGFVSSRLISHAQTAFDHMMKAGLHPDHGIFRAMISGYALSETHNSIDAVRFVESMRNYGLKPDMFILSRIAGIYLNEGDLYSAQKYLVEASSKFTSNHYDVSVLVYFYNHLLRGYIQKDMMTEAAFYYDQMDALRVERNVYTYLIMILGYWKSEKYVAAGAVYAILLTVKRSALFRSNRELLTQRRLTSEIIPELERLLEPFFSQPLFGKGFNQSDSLTE